MAVRPEPHCCFAVTVTGDQPKLTALFTRRYKALKKRGEFEKEAPLRLIDRRPVKMLPPGEVRWKPEPKSRRVDKREMYDHPKLTTMQRMFRTRHTLGEDN
jgi:hypothetical protein